MSGASPGRRLRALVRKECYQVLRDPSALLIAFVLPPILLFLFAFAVSLDVENVPVGVVLESDSSKAQGLAAAFAASRYLDVHPARHRREVESLMVGGELRAFVVIPADFEVRLRNGQRGAAIQIITDGSQPNSASFTAAYTQGVFSTWLASQLASSGGKVGGLQLEPRFWFNPELASRNVLLPGAMAIVMTMIGTLLTALVVAREWERGTMEAVMSTQASMMEIIASKLLPYFFLGSLTTLGCTLLAVGFLGLPFRGSMFALLCLSAIFLVPALGQGLLISTLAKNQFVASQFAVLSAFLPALLLSGFIFEIQSMPWIVQKITLLLPARYYVSGLQTIFLAGDLWPQLLRDMSALLAVGAVFFGITFAHSRKRLD